MTSGYTTAQSVASNVDARLLGEWLIDDGATYTLTANTGTASDGTTTESKVKLAIVDYDGEVFEVRSLTWNEGVLAWTYFVPSSNTTVSEQTVRIHENRLEVQWENSTGATGIDILNRVE
ncbi:MAG: hypothetical protein Rubg2KO_20130 [Rubricoccaceae bacterium]